MSKFFLRNYNNKTIRQRPDGYLSATDMCKACGKLFGNWYQLKSTTEYLQALQSVIGIPITELVQVFQGGIPEKQGTWVHRKVAIHLAQWLSPEFSVQVSNWIEELMTTGKVEIISKPKTAIELAEETVRLAQQNLQLLLELERQKMITEELETENELLSEAVDELFNYSSIIRVAKFNNMSETLFSWRVLKTTSKQINAEIKKVPCPRFEWKNLYSHDAWRIAYPHIKLPETTTLTIPVYK